MGKKFNMPREEGDRLPGRIILKGATRFWRTGGKRAIGITKASGTSALQIAILQKQDAPGRICLRSASVLL